MDIGKRYSLGIKVAKSERYRKLMEVYKTDSELNIRNYIKEKKNLAKLEIEQIKEKMDLKKCKDFIEGDRPTKCFFQKFRKNDLKPFKIKARR